MFAVVADPVGAGYVESLARPGGNVTGFTVFEYSIAGKWLELLKEIAPHVTRAVVLRDSAIAAGPGFFGAIQAPASSLGIELRPVDVRDASQIERSVAAFAQQGSNGGLIVTGSPAALVHRDLIVALAARHRLPAVYGPRPFVVAGGLICFGPDFLDQLRRAAGYVDRILKGEKPADLPVQAPTKYELVINLKTAKALGLTVPDDTTRSRRRGDRMRRREFITLLGGAAAAWPLMARAQAPTMPVIGHLDSQAPGTFADFVLPAFRHGLKDTGYVEGENVAIVYRWAENQVDRLPSLAAELVRRRVAVIVASGGPPVALAAKAATTTIPIVFGVGDDPVKIGLVASLARPGGNLTGINFFASELAAKRMELLREMVPAAGRIAVLVDPTFPLTQSQVRDAETAARAMGLQTQVLNASTNREINAAFATFARERSDALYVGASPFLASRRVQLALLAGRYGIPAIYGARLFTEAGGLMNYGAKLTDAYRQIGIYTGRILKGTKPADLPVVQSTKFELVINAETARMLGLTVPPSLLAIADEVIE